MFVARRKLLKDVFGDPEFGPRLEKAKSVEETGRILEEYCRKHKIKVEHVNV